ncbi:MAG: sugar dehydratase, partial [Armatimonadota bacterium]
DLVRAIIGSCGRTDLKPEILGTAGHGEIDEQYLSSERAKQVLGWEAETALADGLQRTCEWYREYLQAG